ncbi:MAG TPA: hypothetical protein VN577_24115 [Terriglobales bacterium]|nr:hypothetical protein [Terriglobales bacterium]
MDPDNSEHHSQLSGDSAATQLHYCDHTKVDGSPCRAVAVRGSRFCHFHRRYNDDLDPTRREYFFNSPFPALEDPRAVVLSVYNALGDYRRGHLDAKGCAMHLYGLQIASNMMPRPDARSPLEQQQLEQQALARELLKLQPKLKQPKPVEPEEKPPEEEAPSLAQLLLDSLQELKNSDFVRRDDVAGLQEALKSNQPDSRSGK